MGVLHVFVDEFGDANLDTTKDGVTSTYILVGVCARDSDLQGVLHEAELIRKKYFQSGEMKSSSIGQNVDRRIEVLKRISRMGSFAIAFCARKDGISSSSGLQYKKTFIKYFARKLYERLSRYNSRLVVRADKHGSPEFQDEFRRYLESRFKNDLFHQSTFELVDSKDDVLVQTADILAGSLARIYDQAKVSTRSKEIQVALADALSLTIWPEGHQPLRFSPEAVPDEVNERIRRYCVDRVEAYMSFGGEEDLEQRIRLEFLDLLLSHHAWAGDGDYIATKQVLRELSRRIGEPITEHKFRSSVVAKLRDSEVVISSCSRGYKIPSCYADMHEFVAFANTIIPPMVSRVEMACRSVREATMGEADVLSEEGFERLAMLVGAVR